MSLETFDKTNMRNKKTNIKDRQIQLKHSHIHKPSFRPAHINTRMHCTQSTHNAKYLVCTHTHAQYLICHVLPFIGYYFVLLFTHLLSEDYENSSLLRRPTVSVSSRPSFLFFFLETGPS